MSLALYRFIADFPAAPELAHEFPSGFIAHDGLLLLRQSTPQRDDPAARAAAARAHGLRQFHIVEFGMVSVDALSKSNDAGFLARCQEALREGSAVIYYPESRPKRPEVFATLSPAQR